MVGMFDAGLRAATTSGNYDKARAFANERLENAKSLSFAAADADGFPNGSAPSSCGTGCRRYDGLEVPASAGLPAGSSYRVDKRYLTPPDPANSPASYDLSDNPSSTPSDLMQVTVRVSWSGGTYETSGMKTDETP